MHYHCEIIMPKTEDIGQAIASIMAPFSENKESTDEFTGSEFWDFYVIGGRWAGTKETCAYDENKIEAFFKALREKNITISALQFGKQSIKPASQIPMVDKVWNTFFPTENGEIVPCPFFNHSNNQFDSDDLISCDICRVEEIPESLNCSRVIIAGPSYDGKKTEATFMICDSQWNGVNLMPIDWDGNVKTAIKMFEKHSQHYRDEYRKIISPKKDWLCITLDYHS